MKKTCLVSGAVGFIGVHLCNALIEKGYAVCGIDIATTNLKYLNKNVSFLLGDIRKHLSLGAFDYIYHCAALKSVSESFKAPEEYISTNVYGTYNLIRSYPKSRFMNISSSAAGENQSVYGISKRCSEHYATMHNNSVNLRLMNVFGEYQIDQSMAIPAFAWSLKNSKPAIIYGDGSIQRDYIYVGDLIPEIIRIGESKIKGQTEIGYGEPIKIIDLYKQMAKLFKKKENIIFSAGRRGDMKITKSKVKIKEPLFGYAEGLRRSVKYYIQNENF